jgi:hypothetical protein
MPKSSGAKTQAIYDVHPGVAMVQKWIGELKTKTGRSLDEWIAFATEEGPKDDKARRAWLKSKYNLGTNSAWWISERVEGKGREQDTPERYLATATIYVDEQYAGVKQHLRPMYEALLKLGKSLGRDVKACPCKTMVPLYREHVFAQIKPTGNSRIDLGLCFTNYKGRLPKRLIETGGLAKKDRITHRIPVSSLADIDDELKKWLKAAYDLDA